MFGNCIICILSLNFVKLELSAGFFALHSEIHKHRNSTITVLQSAKVGLNV